MRGLFGLLIVGSLYAIGTVVVGGLDDAYQLGEVATLSGTRVLLAGIVVIGGSVAALASTGQESVPTESGVELKRTYRPGPIVLAVGLLAVAAFLIFIETSETSVEDLSVGDPFDDPADDNVEVSLVDLVPCGEPHDSEVYATVSMGGTSSAFPGRSAMDEDSWLRCLERFEAFVGTPYDLTTLDIVWLSPTAESWSLGDRQVTCAVYRLDRQKMTGSARNSGI